MLNDTKHLDRSLYRILVIDPFAEDKGHLINDDLFWAQCLEPITDVLEIRTSPTSAENVHRQTTVKAKALPALKWCARWFRLRLMLIALLISCKGYDHVIFQSFEEVSTLLFMLRHPGKRVHVMLSNNLSLERVARRPFMTRLFLGQVLRRAATVFAHCQFEADLIRREYKAVDPRRVTIKPFHQIGFPRTVRPWAERAPVILFMGPLLACKPFEPVLELIRGDAARRFRYTLCSMRDLDSNDLAFLEAQPNVELRFGYVEDEEYYRRISEASLVLLPHNALYEGRLSGNLCDAIASGTPVITQDIAPANEFFAQFGPMGYLADYKDPAWCSRVLDADMAGDFEQFQRSMAACRASCSMEAIRDVVEAAVSRAAED